MRDPRTKDLVDRVMKNPDLFPDEFWAAVIHRVQNSPTLRVTQDQLPPNVALAATDDAATSRKIEWHSDQRGGAVVADVQAYTGLGPTIVAESIGKGATSPSQAIVQTRNPDEVSGVGTSLTVEQNEAITAAKRRAAVYVPRESDGALIGKTIFDSLGASDFLLAGGGVTSADIVDGTIVNADINAAAAIALSKLATDLRGAYAYNCNGSGNYNAQNTWCAATFGTGTSSNVTVASNTMTPTISGIYVCGFSGRFNGAAVPARLLKNATEFQRNDGAFSGAEGWSNPVGVTFFNGTTDVLTGEIFQLGAGVTAYTIENFFMARLMT